MLSEVRSDLLRLGHANRDAQLALAYAGYDGALVPLRPESVDDCYRPYIRLEHGSGYQWAELRQLLDSQYGIYAGLTAAAMLRR